MENLEALREWLLQHGISAEELDEFQESPVVKHIGEGLMLSLINDDVVGSELVTLMLKVFELEERIAVLEGSA